MPTQHSIQPSAKPFNAAVRSCIQDALDQLDRVMIEAENAGQLDLTRYTATVYDVLQNYKLFGSGVAPSPDEPLITEIVPCPNCAGDGYIERPDVDLVVACGRCKGVGEIEVQVALDEESLPEPFAPTPDASPDVPRIPPVAAQVRVPRLSPEAA